MPSRALALALLLLSSVALVSACGGAIAPPSDLSPAVTADAAVEAASALWWSFLASGQGSLEAGVMSRQAVGEEVLEDLLRVQLESAYGGTVSVDVTEIAGTSVTYTVNLEGCSAAGGQLALSGSYRSTAVFTVTGDGTELVMGGGRAVEFTGLYAGMTTVTGTLVAVTINNSHRDLNLTYALTARRGEDVVAFQGSGRATGAGDVMTFVGSFASVTINNSHRTVGIALDSVVTDPTVPYPVSGGLAFAGEGGQYRADFNYVGGMNRALLSGPGGSPLGEVELPPLG